MDWTQVKKVPQRRCYSREGLFWTPEEKRQRERSAEKQLSPYTCNLPPSPPWMSRNVKKTAARGTNIPHEIRKAALDRSRWRDYEGHTCPMALQGPIR